MREYVIVFANVEGTRELVIDVERTYKLDGGTYESSLHTKERAIELAVELKKEFPEVSYSIHKIGKGKAVL